MKSLLPVLGLLGVSTLLFRKSSPSSSVKEDISSNKILKIAVFDSVHVSAPAYAATLKFFDERKEDYIFKSVKSEDIRNDALQGMDIVIFMGGSGGGQAKDLGEKGRAKVRDFIKSGGGYIGVCAGAYMALQPKEGSSPKLAIVAGQHYGEGWQRGMGPATIKTSSDEEIELFYANGPLFEKVSVSGLKPFISLGKYVSDYYIPKKKTYEGEMPGKPALIISEYGKGRVFLYSPNPLLGTKGVKNTEIFEKSLKWVGHSGPFSSKIKFDTIFK